MDHHADGPLQPGEARVEDEVDKAGEGSRYDTALAPIHALLLARQCRVLIYRQGRVGSAVSIPIYVVRMVIVVVLRPYVLRHSRKNAHDEADPAIEAAAAKEAPVAALVHQPENADREEDDEHQGEECEPGGNSGKPDGAPPEQGEGDQGREDLRPSFDVVGLRVATNHGAFLALQAVIRQHDRTPPRSSRCPFQRNWLRSTPCGSSAVCCMCADEFQSGRLETIH